MTVDVMESLTAEHIIKAIICTWSTLRRRQDLVKLALYRRFTYVLIFYVLGKSSALSLSCSTPAEAIIRRS